MWQAYFVAYRVNYVQAITSQERQGAGFVDSVATAPMPSLTTTLGGTIAAVCSRCQSRRNLRIRHGHATPDQLPDQASAVSTRPFVSGSSSAAAIRMP
jgi:hypothetical protein